MYNIDDIVSRIRSRYKLRVVEGRLPNFWIISDTNLLSVISDRILVLSCNLISIYKVFDIIDYTTIDYLVKDIVNQLNLDTNGFPTGITSLSNISTSVGDGSLNPIVLPKISYVINTEDDHSISIFSGNLSFSLRVRVPEGDTLTISLGKMEGSIFCELYILHSIRIPSWCNATRNDEIISKMRDKLVYWINPGRTDSFLTYKNPAQNLCPAVYGEFYKDPRFKNVIGYWTSKSVKDKPYLYHFGNLSGRDNFIVMEDREDKKLKAFLGSLQGTAILINKISDFGKALCKDSIMSIHRGLKDLENVANVKGSFLSERIFLAESTIQIITPTEYLARVRYVVNFSEKIKFTVDYVIDQNSQRVEKYCIVGEQRSRVIFIDGLIRYYLLTYAEPLSSEALEMIPK